MPLRLCLLCAALYGGSLVAVPDSFAGPPGRSQMSPIAPAIPVTAATRVNSWDVPRLSDIAMYDQDARRRLQAVRDLASLRELMGAGARAIAYALSDPDDEVRLAAAEALVWCSPYGAPVGVGDYTRLLNDPDDRVRAAGVEAIASAWPMLAPAQLEALMARRNDPAPGVRLAVVRALGHASRDTAADAALMVTLLEDPDADIQAEAARMLGRDCQAPPPVRDALLTAMRRDPTREVRLAAASGFRDARSDSEADAAALIGLVDDHSAGVREEAAVALGGVLGRAEVIAVLVRLAGDGDAPLRAAVMDALGRVGRDNGCAILAVRAHLGDTEPLVRVGAAQAAARLGYVADAVPVLAAGLRCQVPEVRLASAEIVASPETRVGYQSELLSEALTSSDAEVRCAALRTMGDTHRYSFNGMVGGPPPANLLHDGSLAVRVSAAETLARMGEGLAPAARALAGALTDDKQPELVRMSVAKALGGLAAARVNSCVRTQDLERRAQLRARRAMADLGDGAHYTTEALLAALDDPSPYVRNAVVDAIPQYHNAGVCVLPNLMDLALGPVGRARSAACVALGEIGTDAGRAVRRRLGSGSADARCAAARAAAEAWTSTLRRDACLSGGPRGARSSDPRDAFAAEIVPALREMLDSPEARLRVSAIRALAVLPYALQRDMLPSLVSALHDECAEVRAVAVRAAWRLSRRTERAARLLEPLQDDPDPTVRLCAAIDLMWNMNSACLARPSLLMAGLRHPDTGLRAEAIFALGRCADVSDSALDEVAMVIRTTDDWRLLNAAVSAAGQQGERAGAVVPAIRSLLRHRDPEVRGLAAYNLGRIGPAAQDAVPDLKLLMDDRSLSVQSSAIGALGAIGTDDAEVRQELFRRLARPDWAYAAACALAGLPNPERDVIPALVEILVRTAEDEEYYSVGRAFTRLGAAAVPALVECARAHDSPALRLKVLGSPDALAGDEAARALGQIGSGATGAAPALLAATEHVPPERRARIGATLVKVGAEEDGFRVLSECLADTSPSVRQQAAERIGELFDHPDGAANLLLQALTDLPGGVRLAAVRGLGTILSCGDCEERIAPALRRVLATDPDEKVLRAAEDALSFLDDEG